MKNKVSWNAPVGDDWKQVRTSKCGRYSITKKHFVPILCILASSRNGYFARVGYVLLILATGKSRTVATLSDVKQRLTRWFQDDTRGMRVGGTKTSRIYPGRTGIIPVGDYDLTLGKGRKAKTFQVKVRESVRFQDTALLGTFTRLS